MATSHKAKRDGTQPRVATLEYAHAMCAPEHYVSTLRTRAVKSVTSRMMRQLESCDTLSAFFDHWLERGVRVKPPQDPRLSKWLVLAVGESVLTPESRDKQPVVVRKAPAWCQTRSARRIWEDCLRSGIEAEFQSPWPWAPRCAGDVDSCRDRGAPQKHENCLVFQTRQVGSAVRSEGAHS